MRKDQKFQKFTAPDRSWFINTWLCPMAVQSATTLTSSIKLNIEVFGNTDTQ